MTADQDVDNALNGTSDGTNTLSWAQARLRMRTTLTNILQKVPFLYQYSRLDQITTTAEQIAWRYVDADGLVWDHKSWTLVQIEAFKDSITPAKLAQYRKNADVLRPWPTIELISGVPFTGILPGDPTQEYPAYPPVAG